MLCNVVERSYLHLQAQSPGPHPISKQFNRNIYNISTSVLAPFLSVVIYSVSYIVGTTLLLTPFPLLCAMSATHYHNSNMIPHFQFQVHFYLYSISIINTVSNYCYYYFSLSFRGHHHIISVQFCLNLYFQNLCLPLLCVFQR